MMKGSERKRKENKRREQENLFFLACEHALLNGLHLPSPIRSFYCSHRSERRLLLRLRFLWPLHHLVVDVDCEATGDLLAFRGR